VAGGKQRGKVKVVRLYIMKIELVPSYTKCPRKVSSAPDVPGEG